MFTDRPFFVCLSGWGEIPSSHSKSESSWGEPAPSPVTVDNGTSAWGKPTGSCGSWGDGNPGMASTSCKTGKQFFFSPMLYTPAKKVQRS